MKDSPDRVRAGTMPDQYPRSTRWMVCDELSKPGTLKPHYHAVGGQIYSCLVETDGDIGVFDVIEKP